MSAKIPAHTARTSGLWQPVLTRAAVAAIFGLLTVFWQDASTAVLSVAGGLYLVLTGAAVWGLRGSAAGASGVRRLLPVEITGYLLGGVLAMVLPGPTAFTVVACAVLLIAAAVEISLGLQNRGRHPLATDWLITGIVSLGAAVLLPAFVGVDAHALLGVLGGSAIVIAVVLLLAALSYRHEARQGAAEDEQAVN